MGTMSQIESKEKSFGYLVRIYFTALHAAARQSIPNACAQFGVDVDFAKQVAGMSILEIEDLANHDAVCFKPTIDASQFIKLRGIPNSTERAIVARLVTKH